MRDELFKLGYSEVQLTEGTEGIFDILIEGEEVFSKKKSPSGNFPLLSEIENLAP